MEAAAFDRVKDSRLAAKGAVQVVKRKLRRDEFIPSAPYGTSFRDRHGDTGSIP